MVQRPLLRVNGRIGSVANQDFLPVHRADGVVGGPEFVRACNIERLIGPALDPCANLVRELKPSLVRMRSTCPSTVRREITSRFAIS